MDLHTSSEGKLIESISQNSGMKLKATAGLLLGKPLLARSLTETGGYADAISLFGFMLLRVCGAAIYR